MGSAATLSSTAGNTGSTANLLDGSDLTSTLGLWGAQLREITQLERTLSEQDTIVQVYRTSLEKDSQSLIKVGFLKINTFLCGQLT